MFSVDKEEAFGTDVFTDGAAFVAHGEGSAFSWRKRNKCLRRFDAVPTSLNLSLT